MADNIEQKKSQRDGFRERLGKSRPELNLDDDEAVYGAISEDYDNFESNAKSMQEENDRYKRNEKALVDYATANKNNGLYLEGALNGKDIFETAVELHGYDNVLEYLQSEEARDKYKKANDSYQNKLKKSKQLDEEAESNRVKTDEELNSAIQNGEFSVEDCNKAIDFLMDINDALNVNVCKVEWIKMALKAMNYDNDIENAREDGRISGVNEGVEKQMRKKNSSVGAGKPSMPVAGGGKGATEQKKMGGSLTERLFNN